MHVADNEITADAVSTVPTDCLMGSFHWEIRVCDEESCRRARELDSTWALNKKYCLDPSTDGPVIGAIPRRPSSCSVAFGDRRNCFATSISLT